MASIRKKVIRGRTYYYLGHTVRRGKKFSIRERYLGTSLPKNVEKIKKEFLFEIYREKWFSSLEKIRLRYAKEIKRMPRSISEKEMATFAIKFTYDTQRIEGSSLTHRETADLLERGIAPKSRPIGDIKEAEAHREVFYEMLNFKGDLKLDIILYWHRKLFENTKREIAGEIRNYQVRVSGSKFVPPSPVEVYPILMEMIRWYNKSKNKLNPVELAALTHAKFEGIHPFGDGNGRVGRIIMNFILNKFGYPMLDIQYVNRSGYYTALERSHTKGDDYIFVIWFFKRYMKEHKSYLNV